VLARDATVLANNIRQLAQVARNSFAPGKPTSVIYSPTDHYASRWEGDAIAYRDEMIRRLTGPDGVVSRESTVNFEYSRPNGIGLEMIASDLARLASMLPQK